VDNSVWIVFALLLMVTLWENYNNKRFEIHRHIKKLIKSEKSKERQGMIDIIKDFIGKECIISTMKSDVIGVVESVQDNWVRVKTTANEASDGNTSDIINIDYISRIRLFPRKKTGKKKTFWGYA
jgi:hypothetical protein